MYLKTKCLRTRAWELFSVSSSLVAAIFTWLANRSKSSVFIFSSILNQTTYTFIILFCYKLPCKDMLLLIDNLQDYLIKQSIKSFFVSKIPKVMWRNLAMREVSSWLPGHVRRNHIPSNFYIGNSWKPFLVNHSNFPGLYLS